MTETTDDLDRSAGDMMPSPGEIALRLRYLELGADDLALLRRIHPLLQPRLEPVIEAFYTHLLSMPVLRPLLGDGAALARLRRVQAGYFRSLTAGDYGDDYVRNRLRVGLVHQRIGLAPVWYLGGYRKYLTDLAPVLRELLRDSPDTFLPTYGALFKVVNFDMSLALDTYIQAGRRKLLGLKNYSEQIISSMPSGVMVVDGGGAVRTVNQAMLGMLGGQRGGAGLRYDELVGDAALRACIAEGLDQPAYQRELTVTLPDGPRHLRCCLSRTLLDKQDLLLLIAEDITAPMQARAELRDSEERYRAAFGQAAVGLAEVSADGSWLRVNRKLLDIVGYSEDELLRLRLSDIVSPEDWQIDAPLLRSLAAGALQSSSREKRYLCKDGRAVWVKATVAAMRPAGDQASLVAVIEDISQRKQFEEELLHLASHDALTGLANRKVLDGRLALVLDSLPDSLPAALVMLDLDHFKPINDTAGHAAGDAVLRAVAAAISSCVRTSDLVVRLGGDEFALLLEHCALDVAMGIADKVRVAIGEIALPWQQHTLRVGASLGVAALSADTVDALAWMSEADGACYSAKAQGRDLVRAAPRSLALA